MTKKYIFWLQTADKIIKTVISPTKSIYKVNIPLKGAISPVREDISSVEEKRKSRVGQLSLSSVTEDQSPLRVATKTDRKRHGESSGQEKRKKIRPSEGLKSVVSEIDNQCEMCEIDNYVYMKKSLWAVTYIA